MTLHGSTLTIVLSIAAALAVGHAAVCAYALALPGDVADELCKPQRSFLAWLFLLSLRIGRYDAEADLQPSLSTDIVAANCRRRAAIGMAFSLVSLAVLAFIVFRQAL